MFSKKILSVMLGFALVAMGAFAISSVTSYGVTYNAAAGDTATQNITEMIEDLVPSFVLLIFVMVFMLMLLTIVDRVGKH
jgi:mannose/fructose/N-acetylgalactosamine-specific phosphotransferase system component IID